MDTYRAFYVSGQIRRAIDCREHIEAALDHFDSAVAKSEEALAPINELLDIADFHLKRREFFEAQPLFERCLVYWRTFCPDAADTGLNILWRLTELLLASRRAEEAEPFAREALSLVEQQAAKTKDVQVQFARAGAACLLAATCHRNGKLDDAVEYYVSALQTWRRQKIPARPHQLPETLSDLAIVHLERKKPDLAVQLLREAYEKLSAIPGEQGSASILALARIAFAEKELGHDEFNRSYDCVAEMLKDAIGSNLHAFLDHFEQSAHEKHFTGKQLDALIDLALVREVRKRNPQTSVDVDAEREVIQLDGLLEYFSTGDYARIVREPENALNTLEQFLVRLQSLQRLNQLESAKTLGSNLLSSSGLEPFDRALIRLLLGEVSGEDVISMAKNQKEQCRGTYYAAARTFTESGFEAARPMLEDCAATDVVCFERSLAKLELAAADASPLQNGLPLWAVDDLVEGQYRVRSINYDGAMSLVYFVWHEGWSTELAIKLPRIEMIPDRKSRDRLKAEANTWVDLGLHPNIVTCFCVRDIGGVPAIVMDKIDGGSVKDAMRAGRLASIEQVLDIAIQIVRGLLWAQERIPGFTHRDIKPANVLLTTGGIAKITDFGLANIADQVAGTPAYMPPEVWLDPSNAQASADVYSFGAMLFEMLTGERVFPRTELEAADRLSVLPKQDVGQDDPDRTEVWRDEETADMPQNRDSVTELMLAHLHEVPRRVDQLRPGIPASLNDLCLRMLSKAPDQRPQTAELLAELSSIFEEVTSTAYKRAEPAAFDLLSDSLNNQALSMLDLGRVEDANRLWAEASRHNATNPAVVYNIGLQSWRSGAITDSDLLERLEDTAAAAIDPSSVSYLKALIHLERGDAESALNLLNDIDHAELSTPPMLAAMRDRARAAASKHPDVLIPGIHDGTIQGVRISENGSTVISGSMDGTVKRCQLDNRNSITLGQHDVAVFAVDVSTDWSTAASMDTEGLLKCWNLDSGECFQNIKTNERAIVQVALSADGATCLSQGCGPVGSATLWETATGRQHKTLRFESGLASAAFGRDEDVFITTDRSSMRFWRSADAELIKQCDIPQCLLPWRPIAFNHSANTFVTPAENVDIAVCDLVTGQLLHSLCGHKDAVSKLSWASGSEYVASAGTDQTVRLWDVRQRRCLRSFEVENVSAIDISPDGTRVAVGTEQGDLRILFALETSFTAPLVLSPPKSVERLAEISEAARVARDESRALLEAGEPAAAAEIVRRARNQPGLQRHPVLLDAWQALYPKLTKESIAGVWMDGAREDHRTFVQAIRISKTADRVLAAGRDGVVTICSCDGSQLLATQQFGAQGELRVNDSGDGDPISLPPMFWSADISPDGHLVAAGAKNRLEIREALSGNSLHEIAVGDATILTVRFSHKANRLATAIDDGTVLVYDSESGECVCVFRGHTHTVTAMAFDDNDRLLVTTGEDQTIRVWSLEEQNLISVFGDEFAGPMVSATDYMKVNMRGPQNGVRAMITNQTHYMHRPMRRRAERAMALAVDQQASQALRAIGERLELWDLSTGSTLRVIDQAHKGLILDADITSDGCFAVSTGIDRYVRFWNLATGESIHSIHTEQEPWSIKFAPTEDAIYTGEFGAVTRWKLDWTLSDTGAPRLAVGEITPAQDADLPHKVNSFLAASEVDVKQIGRDILRWNSGQLRSLQVYLAKHIPALIHRMQTAVSEEVSCAAMALIFGAGGAAVPALRSLLKNPNGQQNALNALGYMGRVAEPAVSDIISLLDSDNGNIGLKAGFTLFSIGPETIPALCSQLKTGSPETRRRALYALSHFSGLACPAIPSIEEAIQSTDDKPFQAAGHRVIDAIRRPDKSRVSADQNSGCVPLAGCLAKTAAVVTCLVILIGWIVRSETQKTERSRAQYTASQHLAHGRDIVQMWLRGVESDRVPALLPAEATRFFTMIIESEHADSETRDEANRYLTLIKKFPHYLKVAPQISDFQPVFDDLANVFAGSAGESAGSEMPRVMPTFSSGVLVITALPREVATRGARFLLDADMTEVCGPSGATTPDELATLIVLQWRKKRIGEYRMPIQSQAPSEESESQLLRLPQYSHICDMKIVDVDSRKLISTQRFEQQDPDHFRLSLMPDNRGGGSQDALRKQVLGMIKRLLQ